MSVVMYPALPVGSARSVGYDVIAVAAVGFAFLGLGRQRPAHRAGWLLVLLGFAGWVVGDLVYSAERGLFGITAYPAPSDAVYIGSYFVLAAGLQRMVRRRGQLRDLTPLLDAAIVATGAAVVAGVFVIAPIAHDSTLTMLGKLTSSLYPLADVVLVGILVRLWMTPGARTAAFRLLLGALGLTLSADVAWNVWSLSTGLVAGPWWQDSLWLGSYLLVAAATWSSSMHVVSEPAHGAVSNANPRRRLFVLAGGLMLPGVSLAADGLLHARILWQVVAVGSIVLSGLVLTRMAGLLTTVQAQAVQLAALARADGLTGAPNRRTWDHELSRACRSARDSGAPLVVALLDLDHFKSYNDTHGHQAGDRLLREAVSAWTDLLEVDQLLARYGGEEFAVLFPGRTEDDAYTLLQRLHAVTPHGQTFSAGLALWDPTTEPAAVIGAADAAMYDAKRSGRNRVVISERAGPYGALTDLTIVLQPLVHLADGETFGMEALSRFPDRDPVSAFADAYRDGRGFELEAAAITAALVHRTEGLLLSINVSLDALSSNEVLTCLPDDLAGIMLEVTEHSDLESWADLQPLLADLRHRGAIIAVDDWGQGYSNLDRLLRLQPEVVKLDISLVHGVQSAYHRATIRSITGWADEVGATVCAEGIETHDQWRQLRELGVHSGQGYLFGRPTAPTAPKSVSDTTPRGDPVDLPAAR
ncbi:bifunctional diguanylate cyclase/phosphodiesterase [Nocardioides panacis]|uniref:Bifunctional diguanylate cyclase/phosphodiesterase n=1 Tax=Nocardioides panacis TaxID=2849501 RepID=A0A975Y207_9ACTN|nr:bifunctional diguanylate cyclase/phosphodiesterase [Nocardioides panacis]QWZ10055.1 bifunctional diguanylate cyclase/phosphodiesterase [Nocardioides panacis]